MRVVPQVAAAYLEGDDAELQTYSDPDRLQTAAALAQENVRVEGVRPCGVWGNARLAIAWVNASYEAETKIGQMPVMMVLRRPSSRWQLLAAARDAVSTGAFIREAPSVTALLERNGATSALPAPATILGPAAGHYPAPLDRQRFGMFQWRSSPSDDIVAEIGEFAYENDARLVFRRPVGPGVRNHISAGALWTTHGVWNWRIWSVTRSGDVVFSETRSFAH